MTSFTRVGTFQVWDCCSCGVQYAVTKEFDNRRRQDHKSFYCPNGHSQSYRHDNEEEKLRKELELKERCLKSAECDVTREAQRRQEAERALVATKGHLARHKKRAAKGVCPCCNRTVQQLADHMKSKHPEYVKKNKK